MCGFFLLCLDWMLCIGNGYGMVLRLIHLILCGFWCFRLDEKLDKLAGNGSLESTAVDLKVATVMTSSEHPKTFCGSVSCAFSIAPH